MSQTVAEHVLTRLREWGVDVVFGYPGDGINGLVAAWGTVEDPPRFVQARHEEMSALQAVGYAKFSGNVGVCLATSGPGAIHLLNGLYDALLDHVPVVAIVGQTHRSAMGGSYQQEVDLLSLFKDVAHHYVQMVTVPEQLPNVLDRAVRIALAERAPTVVVIPADVQELEYSEPTHDFKMVPSSTGTSWPTVQPDDAGVLQAADVLNSGQKVAILVGQGARGAAAEVREVAGLLGAGVAKALLGKDVLPDDLPFVTGSIGLLGTRPSYEMMRDCDTLLTVGSNFPYSQFLPPYGQARGVQVEIDATLVGLRYPYEVNLVGDAATTLRALLPHLRRKQDRSWQETIVDSVGRWWQTTEQQATLAVDPVNPRLLFWEANDHLPDDVILTCDSGSAANWYARDIRIRDGMRGSLSGTLATMGSGVPYAIGAKFAHPGRPVVALMGDGAMQMNGLAELITIARYWQEWKDPRLVVLVLHNDDLNQVTWELRAMGGSPKITDTQTLPDVDYAAFARSVGLEGINVERPDDVGPAWRTAFGAGRPAVIDARVSPSMPPIPPHATFEQIKDSAQALLRGDENAWDVLTTGIRAKAQEYLPKRDG